MDRNILARVLTVVAAALVVFHAGKASGQGEGLLNQVDVSDSRSLNLIKEVLAFNAFEPDPKTGTLKFVFDFSDLEHNTGISPTLIISRDGKRVAHVRPEVFFVEAGVMRKTPYNTIEFDVSPEFVRDSWLLIQFLPNTEKLVTYKIGLLAATILTLKGNVAVKTSIDDLLSSLEARESGTEQNAAGQPAKRPESK